MESGRKTTCVDLWPVTMHTCTHKHIHIQTCTHSYITQKYLEGVGSRVSCMIDKHSTIELHPHALVALSQGRSHVIPPPPKPCGTQQLLGPLSTYVLCTHRRMHAHSSACVHTQPHPPYTDTQLLQCSSPRWVLLTSQGREALGWDGGALRAGDGLCEEGLCTRDRPS